MEDILNYGNEDSNYVKGKEILNKPSDYQHFKTFFVQPSQADKIWNT
jgi:hypothetical protein